MSKCVVCGKDSKGKCCSGACRAKLSRTRTVDNEAHAPERTVNLELCQYCGTDLPKLAQPRRYVGACYECAIKQPAKTGDELWPAYRYDDRPHSEQVQMTDQEQANYKPAAELGPSEFNRVSKPGDADYMGCTMALEVGKPR